MGGVFLLGGEGNVREEKVKGSKRGQSFRGGREGA